jgi:tRNA threonylcarbamoyladenosine biosynthesis protein TsaE
MSTEQGPVEEQEPVEVQVQVQVQLADAEATRAYGVRLAGLLRAGDLVVLTGPLGAGKTTLTQGIGEGLHVRGQVASPTFIIARVHPSTVGGPSLVHVDAYRLGSFEELDALDLDASLEESVTVVEWGEGLAEVLSEDRLEVTLDRPHGAGDATGEDLLRDAEVGVRAVTVRAVGPRWQGAALPS